MSISCTFSVPLDSLLIRTNGGHFLTDAFGPVKMTARNISVQCGVIIARVLPDHSDARAMLRRTLDCQETLAVDGVMRLGLGQPFACHGRSK
jgi:hypothetical protein